MASAKADPKAKQAAKLAAVQAKLDRDPDKRRGQLRKGVNGVRWV